MTRLSRRDLDRALISGVGWTAAARWGAQLVSWGSLLFLSRLLAPRDFGLIGMAAVLSGAIGLLSEFGIDGAVFVSRDLTPAKIKHLHFLAIVLGIVGSVIACLSGPVLATFFRTPELVWITPAVGIGFLVSGFRVVPQSLILRSFGFKAIALVEAGQAIVASATAVTMAHFGMSYWSLVVGQLASVLFSSVTVSLLQPCRPAKPVWRDLRQELTISRQLLVSRLGWYIYSNADFAVAGRTLGGSVLGLYTMAWNIASLPVEKVTTLLMRVTPPVMLQVRDQEQELRRHIRGITETLAVVTFPMAFGLALVSRTLVETVLDRRWWELADPLRLLAACASVRSIATLPAIVLTAVGDTAGPMRMSLVMAVILPVSFFYASRWGAVGIAAAWLCVYPILSLPLVVRMLRRTGMPISDYLSALAPAALGSSVMAAAVIGLHHWIGAGLSPVSRLTLEVLSGVVFYVGTILLCLPSRAADLVNRFLPRQ